MLTQFLSKNICIMLTEKDIPFLQDLQNVIGLKWASGDEINSKETINTINIKEPIYIHLSEECGEFCIRYSRTKKYYAVSVEDFLKNQNAWNDYEVTEEDVLNLL